LLARAGDDPVRSWGTSRVQATRLIEKAAGIVNAQTRELLREEDITISADSPFVVLSTALPDCVRVVEVRDGDREIDEVDAREELAGAYEPLARGPRPVSWSMLGRDTLALLPPLTASTTVTVVYAYEPDYGGCSQFDNPTMGKILQVAEMLMAVRSSNAARLLELLGEGPPAAPIVGPGTYRTSVQDAVSDLLARAGDPDAFGTTREQALRLIEKALGIVQANMPDTTTTASLAVGADDPFHPLSAEIPDCARVVRVLDDTGAGDREIDRGDPRAVLYGGHEPLGPGDRIEQWGMIGRDLLFLWPPLVASQTVTVVYSQEQDLSDGAATLESDSLGRVLMVAEMLMCVRTGNAARLTEMLGAI